MADSSQDPYLYPGTEVLRNKPDIRDNDALKRREADAVAVRVAQLAREPIAGPFEQKRLTDTHRVLFGDIYEWAGQLRSNTGMMRKTRHAGYTVAYGPSEYVQPQLTEIFNQLKTENYLRGLDSEGFAKRLAYFYSELDSAHPFREGNSRTLRSFTADLAREAGHPLSWDAVSRTEAQRDALYFARDVGVLRRDSGPLSAIISQAIQAGMERAARAQGREEQPGEPTQTTNPPDFFRKLASTRNLPSSLALPDRAHAEYLLDSVFKVPTGRELVRVLCQKLQPGEERSQSIRGIFTLTVKADQHRTPHFALVPQPGREGNFAEVLRTAAEENLQASAKTRPRTTVRSNDRTR